MIGFRLDFGAREQLRSLSERTARISERLTRRSALGLWLLLSALGWAAIVLLLVWLL